MIAWLCNPNQPPCLRNQLRNPHHHLIPNLHRISQSSKPITIRSSSPSSLILPTSQHTTTRRNRPSSITPRPKSTNGSKHVKQATSRGWNGACAKVNQSPSSSPAGCVADDTATKGGFLVLVGVFDEGGGVRDDNDGTARGLERASHAFNRRGETGFLSSASCLRCLGSTDYEAGAIGEGIHCVNDCSVVTMGGL